jgi:hypothetical protein
MDPGGSGGEAEAQAPGSDGHRMPTMKNVQSYEQVVDSYGICALRAPADLQLTASSDIAVHDGDLKLGDDRYNAMFRLVQAWRFNSPMLEQLFTLVAESEQAKLRLLEEQEQSISLLSATNWSGDVVKQYHSVGDQIGASELGGAACAGALFVMLNNVLSRFKNDLKISQGRWAAGGPLIKGVSVGSLVAAAANNFRHYDEWRRAKKLSQKQLSSIRIISRALESDTITVRQNVCPRILHVMSEWRYVRLTEILFEFAKTVSAE